MKPKKYGKFHLDLGIQITTNGRTFNTISTKQIFITFGPLINLNFCFTRCSLNRLERRGVKVFFLLFKLSPQRTLYRTFSFSFFFFESTIFTFTILRLYHNQQRHLDLKYPERIAEILNSFLFPLVVFVAQLIYLFCTP